ncbi:TM0106 family RecB-like putative nuclease [Arthrobacter sulfonylureivorans]|uniref:TM0106 family RecB-like putative nuclease n=1 Tax=Arthrobacter sulfonylureivorans TaxID=2486855 RepID=UPI0039E3F20F
MFLLDSDVDGADPDLVYTATDLVTAAQCEYQLLRKLDEKLGRSPVPDFGRDEMLERTAALGDVHEHRVLQQFRDAFGAGVVEIAETHSYTRDDLRAKHAESIAALESGADVVFQASFFDGGFHGRSDFLVKTQHDGGAPAYAVYDTKLARHAKVTALLQLAAYGDQLLQAGISTAPTVTLVLGDGRHSDHSLTDLLPAYRERRGRFLDLVAGHRSQSATVRWGDERIKACGRCDYCAEQVELHRDLLLVANMSTVRRRKLRAAGIQTIDQLAALELPTGEAHDGALARLRDQAQMQTGTAKPDGTVTFRKDGAEHTVAYRVLEQHTLGRLPVPDPGDIFFDFEGDPLWQDGAGVWGLEYLFGVVENPPAVGSPAPFKPFWAHSRSGERQALADFLDYVSERRRRHPGLHIYHYANYEKAALRRLSLQHLVGEETVDELLREGILVDLYDTVRHSLRISENSYSIKKLEPLYMGDNLRAGDVKDAGASVVAYAQYCTARDTGYDAEADTILKSIADYNEYDCLSTLELRNWLLRLAAERGVVPGRFAATASAATPEDDGGPLLPQERRLLDFVAAAAERAASRNESLSPEEQAVAMVAASVGYHRREEKQFWWAHFDRLDAPVEDWADVRDVFTVESAQVLSEWAKPNSRSNPVRVLRLTGRLAPGSTIKEGSLLCRLYDRPYPAFLCEQNDGVNHRAFCFDTEALELGADGVKDTLLVKERLPRDAGAYTEFPVALTPGRPVRTTSIREALADLAASVADTLPGFPADPALELLRRRRPRLATLAQLPEVQDHPDGYVDAITAAVADLQDSYLAVQGPPGTGKTYVGSHAIARLVAQGWKVGVVGQSHAVVDNMLRAAIEKAGVSPELVAKKPNGEQDLPWHNRSTDDVIRLLESPGGALIGGTAWTMTGSAVPPKSLDLLVIDEAGQFSLANTLAVSRAAKRLLLLGDPQQLPQVTQGTHPEPVDESALGWLSAGHATLPPELGYFLARSWRMHPDLCRTVSVLAYDGRLESAPAAALRHLEGAPAGLECVYVDHAGNATSSPEEAAEVLAQARRHIGLLWREDAAAQPRPLAGADILVVAPYNAQVQLIRAALDGAGLSDVRVGTVDKFQGQEAPVVIVSTAVSAAAEAPRGMEFVLNRNRNNVAVSRGQWRAVIVRSRALTDYLPARPAGLEELGAFAGLCDCTR